jgi:hypothetical protein
MGTQLRTVEHVLAAIARAQHGVVTRAQLLAAGLSAKEIAHRVRKGALIAVHRGVYRVGHRAPSVEARYLAAVLACGKGAVLSGLSAAHLLRLTRKEPPRPEVTSPHERVVPGVITKRSRSLDRLDAFAHAGIPTTTPARTLTDVASLLSLDDLARACHEAGIHHRTTPRQVELVLARRPTTPGAAKLRGIMSGDTRVTLSALEARFLERLRRANLPLPVTNKVAGSKRVDCRWPERHLTVELDSFRFHNSRHTWDQDRRREREAYARGDHFRRYTWTDVFDEPGAMLAELRALLG